MEEFSTSKASFLVTISLLLHLIFVSISLILSFFVFIIIYAIIVIACLAINLLMPCVDAYTEAVVVSICIKQIIDRKCLQRFRGNNKGERRYKILQCKVCLLARKDKQSDREPSPFGPFY